MRISSCIIDVWSTVSNEIGQEGIILTGMSNELYNHYTGMTGFDGLLHSLCAVQELLEYSLTTREYVRAKKSVPSPYARAFGFAPAVA